MNIFQKVKQGIKTTFHIKDLTPEQKAEREKMQNRKKAYTQEISELQKEAWKKAYEKEQQKQILLYAARQQEASSIKARAKAEQDVNTMFAPKQGGGWAVRTFQQIGKFQQGVSKLFPTPPAKVQDALNRSMGLGGTSKKAKPFVDMNAGMWDIPLGGQQQSTNKKHIKHLGTKTAGVNVELNGLNFKLSKKKGKQKRSADMDMFWKL